MKRYNNEAKLHKLRAESLFEEKEKAGDSSIKTSFSISNSSRHKKIRNRHSNSLRTPSVADEFGNKDPEKKMSDSDEDDEDYSLASQNNLDVTPKFGSQLATRRFNKNANKGL